MATPTARTEPWWLAKKDQAHEAVFSAFKRIDEAQQHRRIINLRHLRLYGDYGATGLSGNRYAGAVKENSQLRYNVIQAAVDTAVSQLGTNKPRIQYLTDNGSYSQQQRAKKRSKFVQGCFYKHKQYEISRQLLHDACIFGDGIQKTTVQGSRIIAERVFPDEYVVDEIEARYNTPPNEFQHKEVSRSTLLEMFKSQPAMLDKIKRAELIRDPFTGQLALADSVSVVEAFHLGLETDERDDDGEEKKTGRHVIAISTGVLFDEPWGCESAFNRQAWMRRPLGAYSRGITETLTGTQIEINYLLQKIQEHMTLAATQWWVQKGSSVDIRKMTNQAFAIGEYSGNAPTPLTVQSISAEYFSHLDRLINYAFQIVGISQMAATQKKPAGVDSAVAMQELDDQQSARFQNVTQSIEEFHVRQGEKYIDCARQIHDNGEDFEIIGRSDRGAESISIKDVIMDRNAYLVQAMPAAFLPSSYGGKIQRAKDLAAISPAMQPHLMSLFGEIPDLAAAISTVNSDYDDAMYCIDRIIAFGDQLIPESTQNLQLLTRLGQSSLLRYEHMSDIPAVNLDNLREYIASAQLMLQGAQPPAMGPMPQQPQLPPGGQPPPQGLPAPPGAPGM